MTEAAAVTLTEKETLVARLFAQESLDCCDSFGGGDNMSWMNAEDIAAATGFGLQAVGGLMTSLADKGLIGNSGESSRGSRYPDFSAYPQAYSDIPALADLVSE
jgi:hypothetical protein